jgi:tetratricopeptide (TPR) repeat protein
MPWKSDQPAIDSKGVYDRRSRPQLACTAYFARTATHAEFRLELNVPIVEGGTAVSLPVRKRIAPRSVPPHFAVETYRSGAVCGMPASGTRVSSPRAMALRVPHRRGTGLSATFLAVLLLAGAVSVAQMPAANWQQQLRERVRAHQFDAAFAIVELRLATSPTDYEAHGWRGRILAWKGRWPEAEREYRLVLAKAPGDIEILTGLADVLLWQNRPQEALHCLDQARHLSPSDQEVLSRRARVLILLGHDEEARAQLRETLWLDPQNQAARRTLNGLVPETRHELRLGVDIDTFNYTDTAQTQALSLNSRWTSRWSTFFETSFYQRYGEHATKGTGSITFRFTAQDWLTAGGAGANDRGVIPHSEAFLAYGHGFRLQNRLVRGLDALYQQHWFWYRGAHVLTIGANQLFYLPREWTWALTVNGARSGFSGTGIEWVPTGSTRLSFPLDRGLSGNLFFAVGSENFAQVDQIGRFSARTFGGGLRYRLCSRQDISAYLVKQDRSQERTQNSFGMSYGIHF